MLGYLSLDIISVFLEAHSFPRAIRTGKTVRFSGQIMSADKCPSIFSRQMETIVYLFSPQKEAIVYLSKKQKKEMLVPSQWIAIS